MVSLTGWLCSAGSLWCLGSIHEYQEESLKNPWSLVGSKSKEERMRRVRNVMEEVKLSPVEDYLG